MVKTTLSEVAKESWKPRQMSCEGEGQVASHAATKGREIWLDIEQ